LKAGFTPRSRHILSAAVFNSAVESPGLIINLISFKIAAVI
jgi:hypothetical protein